MNADFISAIQELGKEKGIDPELLFQAVDDALVAAYKKNTGTNQNVRVDMNKETGEIHVYAQRTVVEGEADGINEMTLEDAQAINPQYLAGDIVEVEVTPKNFGRIAAQNAKQFVVQEAAEMMLSSAVRVFSLTEKTMVFRSLPAGAEITTFFAPAWM
mgnify:CR=1 FL=1